MSTWAKKKTVIKRGFRLKCNGVYFAGDIFRRNKPTESYYLKVHFPISMHKSFINRPVRRQNYNSGFFFDKH